LEEEGDRGRGGGGGAYWSVEVVGVGEFGLRAFGDLPPPPGERLSSARGPLAGLARRIL